jgi:hypothetical protein
VTTLIRGHGQSRDPGRFHNDYRPRRPPFADVGRGFVTTRRGGWLLAGKSEGPVALRRVPLLEPCDLRLAARHVRRDFHGHFDHFELWFRPGHMSLREKRTTLN